LEPAPEALKIHLWQFFIHRYVHTLSHRTQSDAHVSRGEGGDWET
jgi:hypothetical protein